MTAAEPTTAPGDAEAARVGCSPARRPGRPRDPQADEAIVGATVDVLCELGFSGFTVDAVAARAGVGKATIYRRWKTREDLIRSVSETFMEQVALPDTGTLIEDLTEYYWARFSAKDRDKSNRLMGHVLVEAAVNPDLKRLLRTFIADRHTAVGVLLARAKERGEVTVDVDRDLVADMLGGTLLYRSLFFDLPVDRDEIRRLVEVTVRGVSAA